MARASRLRDKVTMVHCMGHDVRVSCTGACDGELQLTSDQVNLTPPLASTGSQAGMGQTHWVWVWRSVWVRIQHKLFPAAL